MEKKPDAAELNNLISVTEVNQNISGEIEEIETNIEIDKNTELISQEELSKFLEEENLDLTPDSDVTPSKLSEHIEPQKRENLLEDLSKDNAVTSRKSLNRENENSLEISSSSINQINQKTKIISLEEIAAGLVEEGWEELEDNNEAISQELNQEILLKDRENIFQEDKKGNENWLVNLEQNSLEVDWIDWVEETKVDSKFSIAQNPNQKNGNDWLYETETEEFINEFDVSQNLPNTNYERDWGDLIEKISEQESVTEKFKNENSWYQWNF